MSESSKNNIPVYNGQVNNDEEQSLQLTDLWALVWDNKWWYVACILAALLAATFYLYKTPKTYSRTEKVIVDEDTQNTMMRDLTSFAGTAARRYTGTNVDNEIEAFAAPDLMQKVVSRLGLETSYIDNQFLRVREMYKNSPVEMQLPEEVVASSFSFNLSKGKDSTFVIRDFYVGAEEFKGFKASGHVKDTVETPVGNIILFPTTSFDKWRHDITVTWVNPSSRAKSYCNRLSAGLSSKQSSVVVLSLKDVFPSRAEAVLGTLLDIYNEEWVENKNQSVRNTSLFINDRLNVIERELGGIEEDIKEYKQSHNITDIQQAGNAYMQQSSAYSAQGFEASNQLAIAKMIKQFINDPAHVNDLMPANSGLSSANIESQIRDYNNALLERDRSLALSSENNPYVQDLNKSLEMYKLAVNRSIDNLISTLQLQVNKIEAQENAILGRLSSTSGQQLELLSIERQQKVKEQLYIFLLQKREENELQGLLTVGNTRLIQRATGSSAPIAPNKMMILLIALILGFGLPFAVFYVMKVLDTTVKGRNDLGKLSVPFLAELPQMGVTANYWDRFRLNRFDHKNNKILVQHGKRDSINEAFRVLRTNLDLMIHKETETQAIMITSFNPNAGKTFTLMNLAASMALKGNKKVVIVDLDLRKATLSKSLGKNGTGAAAFLNAKYDDPYEHIVNVQENLDILPVGSIPPNPAELLVSDRLPMLIQALKRKYDYVFLDCAPIDLVADTSIIAPNADITIFIVRAGLFDKRALPAVDEMYAEGK